ncbi:hypothetical protein SODG_005453 [Sodalis praecaptivus]
MERRLNVELIVFGQRAQHLEIIEVAPIPAANGAAGQGDVLILQNPVGVEVLLHAEPFAGGAGAGRVVEGEKPGFQLGHAIAADRAGEVGGKQQLFRFFVIHIRHYRGTTRETERGFKRFRQALGEILAHFETIDHDFDGMFFCSSSFGGSDKSQTSPSIRARI